MINKRLLVVPQLLVAFFLTPLFLIPARAQESDSGRADEGTTTERKPGITVIVDAAGAVQIIDKPGASPRAAIKGDQIPVDGTVVCGADGQANLALSNGAFFQILENSSFSIAHFEQMAFEFVFANGGAINKRQVEEFGADEAVVKSMDASEEAWNDLPAEPTESKTDFALNYGTMIGQSKKLKTGSQMNITTPIGTAGIRGTIWRTTMQRSGGANSNQFRGNLDVSEGRVDFGSKDGSRSVQVQAGFGMNVQATALPNGGATFSSIGTNPLTPERAQLLTSAVQQVSQAQQVFTAVQGTPEIFANTLQAMKNVDVNNSQATADAVLSLMSGDPAQVQQVSNIVSSLVITRAEPSMAARVVADLVSSLATQSPNLAPNITAGVVATATMAARNQVAPLALAQTVSRAAVSSAVTAAQSQVAAITASAVTVASTRGSEAVAPAIAGTVVGAAITALPAQANLIAATAVNAAANSNTRQEVAQSVVSAVATSAAVNAAYVAIASGADRQAAEKAAAEVTATIRETAANSKFADAVAAATTPQAIQQATTQAQNSYDRGETPNTNGSTGGGDSSPKVDTPKPSQPISQPPPPSPTAQPTPPIPTPTPSPTLTPKPSNG